VLASLLRRVRDFEAAEDALHDAFVQALATWPERGVPERPGAWLLTTATNRATDAARRRTLHAAALTDLSQRSRALEGDPNEASDVEDDRLRLIFTCCHPALDPESRVALTLQAVGGLKASEIARAMLVTEAAMAQRLVRVKRKIRDAGIPYEVPAPEARRERLDGVREVVYLIFNDGHQATASDALHRVELAERPSGWRDCSASWSPGTRSAGPRAPPRDGRPAGDGLARTASSSRSTSRTARDGTRAAFATASRCSTKR
jgi:RNA polymerase sigma-70 factor (ECF subfamily)